MNARGLDAHGPHHHKSTYLRFNSSTTSSPPSNLNHSFQRIYNSIHKMHHHAQLFGQPAECEFNVIYATNW